MTSSNSSNSHCIHELSVSIFVEDTNANWPSLEGERDECSANWVYEEITQSSNKKLWILVKCLDCYTSKRWWSLLILRERNYVFIPQECKVNWLVDEIPTACAWYSRVTLSHFTCVSHLFEPNRAGTKFKIKVYLCSRFGCISRRERDLHISKHAYSCA